MELKESSLNNLNLQIQELLFKKSTYEEVKNYLISHVYIILIKELIFRADNQ